MDGAHEAFVGEELKGLGICGKVVPSLVQKRDIFNSEKAVSV